MVNQKVTRWAQALVDQLSALLGSLYTVTTAFDGNTDIYVTVALVAGGNNSTKAVIRLKPASPAASGLTDSLGLTQTVYSPHVVQVIYDITTPFSAGTTELERAYIDGKIVVLGTRVEWYSKAIGASNIAVTDIAAANFIAALDNVDPVFGPLSNL